MTWQDINLEGQYLTVRRSMRYNGARHKTEIGATKRKKIRTVDFCDTLAAILKTAKAEQHKKPLPIRENCIASTITVRSKKKTVLITRFIVCSQMGQHRKMCRSFSDTLMSVPLMNIYAHATREAKRTSARLLDKVVGGE